MDITKVAKMHKKLKVKNIKPTVTVKIVFLGGIWISKHI